MSHYTFNLFYGPASDKSIPFRVAKTKDQAAEALRDFPNLLDQALRAVEITAAVSASHEAAPNGRIAIDITTSLDEQEMHKITIKLLNYLDLYGDAFQRLS